MINIEFHVNENTDDTAVYADNKLVAEGNRLDLHYVIKSLGLTPAAIVNVDTNRVSGSSLTGLPTFLTALNGGQEIPFYSTQSSKSFVDDVIQKASEPLDEDEFFKRMSQMGLGKRGLERTSKMLKIVAPDAGSKQEPAADAVGIRLPQIGEDVYAEGFNGVFRAVQGGLGRVKLLVSRNPDGTYEELRAQAASEPDLSVFREDNRNDEDEDEESDYYGSSYSTPSSDCSHLGASDINDIFVVLEEAPLDMFNWKDLKYRQGELRDAYGDQRLEVELDKLNPEVGVDLSELLGE